MLETCTRNPNLEKAPLTQTRIQTIFQRMHCPSTRFIHRRQGPSKRMRSSHRIRYTKASIRQSFHPHIANLNHPNSDFRLVQVVSLLVRCYCVRRSRFLYDTTGRGQPNAFRPLSNSRGRGRAFASLWCFSTYSFIGVVSLALGIGFGHQPFIHKLSCHTRIGAGGVSVRPQGYQRSHKDKKFAQQPCILHPAHSSFFIPLLSFYLFILFNVFGFQVNPSGRSSQCHGACCCPSVVLDVLHPQPPARKSAGPACISYRSWVAFYKVRQNESTSITNHHDG